MTIFNSSALHAHLHQNSMRITNLVIRIGSTLAVMGILCCVAVPANAQWIFVARHVEGRINQMVQEDQNGKPAYQFATVLLNARADQVYGTAVSTVSRNTAVKVLSQDDTKMTLKLSDGTNRATLTVLPMSDMTSEIMIAATLDPTSQTDNAAVIVAGIMRLCEQMNTVCSVPSK